MKVYSFQHKKVINVLLNNGEYKCNYIGEYHKHAPKLYSYCSERLNEKCGIYSFPVFGWSRLLDKDFKEFDSLESFTLRSIEAVGLPKDDYCLLILNIPSEYVIEQDFYDFASFKCDEEEGLCSDKDLKNFIYNGVIVGNREVQATFPIIKKEWVKSIYDVNIIREIRKFYNCEKVSDVKLKLVYCSQIDNKVSDLNNTNIW